jgi:hypothetical protein
MSFTLENGNVWSVSFALTGRNARSLHRYGSFIDPFIERLGGFSPDVSPLGLRMTLYINLEFSSEFLRISWSGCGTLFTSFVVAS